MPITAKLSRQFYERLGDEVANELVDLLNAMDASSRQEIRETIEASEARVIGRFGQRFAEHDARLEQRFAAIDARFVAIETRLVECGTKRDLEALKADLLRWMILFWVGTMGTVVAILKL